MPSIDFKNYLIRLLDADPDVSLDTSEGSNFRDLFISPLATIFNQYQQEHDRLIDNLSITNPAEMDEQEMDALGSRYLVDRHQGSYASGYIRVYYSEALPISIPKGARFTNESTGVVYETTSLYEATRRSMNDNQDSGLYRTAEIQVRSIERQSDSNVRSGEQLSTSLSNPTPEYVVVSTDITGGDPKEDNESYYRRIKNSVTNSTLASTTVIQQNVLNQSESIRDAEVIGAGNPLMSRDLVKKDSLDPQIVETFKYVDRGQTDDGYYRGHKAFVDTFSFTISADQETDSVVWPNSPDEWVTEFNKQQYRGIYKKDDSLKASDDYYNIIDIPSNFTVDNFEDFYKNDGTTSSSELVFPSEIRLNGGNVLLGKSPQDSQEVRLSQDELQQLEVDLTDGLNEGELSTIESALEKVKEKNQPENRANYSPILHKAIQQHTGINIETTMSTTDKTESGEIAYITALRNDEIFLPHDGYGLAWRKQPQFLIRLNNDNYSDTEQREQDIALFEDYFGTNPEDEGVIGSLSDPANDQYWFYNVYLVDNNGLEEDINIGSSQILDQTSGINQFLQMSKYWIEPDTSYDFKIQITDSLGTKIWVKPSAVTEYDLKIDKGATYPQYIPNAGEKITSSDSDIQSLDSTRGNFGIAVGETKSYEWTVESLEVSSIVQSFSMHLFRFNIDTDKWPTASANFILDYYGVGYDADLYNQEGSGHSKTQAAVWHPDNGWTEAGSHTNDPSANREDIKIEKEFTDLSSFLTVDGYLYVASSAANFGDDFPNDVNHNLDSYYIQLRNPLASYKHLNNAIDVYCHAPDDVIVRNSSEYTVQNGEIIIDEPYIQDIVSVQEANSNVLFDKDQYEVFNNKRGEEFSKDNEIKITMDPSFDGTSLIVRYRYWSSGSNINNYLNSEENRYPGVSIKEKIMPPAIIHINSLEYRGDISEQEITLEIVNYINSLQETTFEKSDLINHLYNVGATFIDLDMEVSVKQYMSNFSFTEQVVDQRYSIPSNTKSRFYAANDTITGVLNTNV